MLFVLSSCSDDHLTYFDVVGEGYAYNRDTNEPIPYAIVRVSSGFKDTGLAAKPSIEENFIADDKGFFRIKFVKYAGTRKTTGCSVSIGGIYNADPSIRSCSGGYKEFSLEELKKLRGTISLDIILASITYYTY